MLRNKRNKHTFRYIKAAALDTRFRFLCTAGAYFAFCNPVLRSDLPDQQRRFRILSAPVGVKCARTEICVAIQASISARIICADVYTFHAAACKPLILIFFGVYRAVRELCKEPVVNTPGMLYAILLQIDLFCAGVHLQPAAMRNFRQILCKQILKRRRKLANRQTCKLSFCISI